MMSPVFDQLEPLSLQMCGEGEGERERGRGREGEGERDIDTHRDGH